MKEDLPTIIIKRRHKTFAQYGLARNISFDDTIYHCRGQANRQPSSKNFTDYWEQTKHSRTMKLNFIQTRTIPIKTTTYTFLIPFTKERQKSKKLIKCR